MKQAWVLALLALTLVWSHVQAEEVVSKNNNEDPLEPYNRAIYNVNDGLDHLILKPVAQGYSSAMPDRLQTSVSHFYSNIRLIPTIPNDFLQGNTYQGTSDAWRFFINTTLGVLGFFDVATSFGYEENSEDMGLTFASWGWHQSSYFIVPFYGPSTLRDTLGMPLDYYLSIYPYIDNVALRNTLYGVGIVNARANLLNLQGIIQVAALDPYVFQRNAYLQRRAYLIKRNAELNAPYRKPNPETPQKPLHPKLETPLPGPTTHV